MNIANNECEPITGDSSRLNEAGAERPHSLDLVFKGSRLNCYYFGARELGAGSALGPVEALVGTELA